MTDVAMTEIMTRKRSIEAIAAVLGAPYERLDEVAASEEKRWIESWIGEYAMPVFADAECARDLVRAVRSARRMRQREVFEMWECCRPQAVGA